MAGLRQTTAKLARYRRQFEKLLAAAATAESPAVPIPIRSRHLKETPSFGANPGNLRMLTYVPERLPENAPLIVVLHGCTQTAASYDVGAGWSELADRYGFVLLLPEQQRANNPSNCFNWFLPGDIGRGSGEAASIRHMIERVIAAEKLDRSRVFVTGLSAGGAMAAVMLATYPEVFAGGAIIAGLPYGAAGNVQEALDAMFQGKSLPPKAWGDLVRAASPHQGPWPKISIWHGSADHTVQPMNADELVKQWTDVHGISLRPPREEIVNGHSRSVWESSSGEALVESYTIAGMAHGTPIAAGSGAENCGAAGPFILEAGISSSHRIAAFWGLVGEEARQAAPSEARGSRQAAAESAWDSTAKSSDKIPLGLHSVRPPFAHRAFPSAPKHPQQPPALDPQTIITKALRRAGLLRR